MKTSSVIRLFAAIAALLCHLAPEGWAQTAPAITRQPLSQTNLAGANVTLSVAVSGTGPFNYQWQFNGTNLPNGIITTVAGDGTPGYSGDGGAATNARLGYPEGVAVDILPGQQDRRQKLAENFGRQLDVSEERCPKRPLPERTTPLTVKRTAKCVVYPAVRVVFGNIYIADSFNNTIRKVGADGIITTVVGVGGSGYSGDGGPAANASLAAPNDVAVDTVGNLYIADSFNNVIRRVDVHGIITTVAGNSAQGFSGDGGAATNAGLGAPQGVAVDAAGNFYIADFVNQRVRKVDPTGIITTVAGNGVHGYAGDGGPAVSAELAGPTAVTMDNSRNLLVADAGNGCVRKIDPAGIITTVAGNGTEGYLGDGGSATNAALNTPSSMAVDIFGNLMIADNWNNRVRRVDSRGNIGTVAGDGSSGYSGDGGAATIAALAAPSSVATDSSGNLLIADGGNSRVRKLTGFGPNYLLGSVSAYNEGDYSVVVTNLYGRVTSAVAVLSVVAIPIEQQLTNVAVLAGNEAQFSVVVSGTPPFFYLWYFNGTNLVQSGTNSTLNFPEAILAEAGNYSVVITNLYGSATSAVANLEVGYPPAITSQPTSQTVVAGHSLGLTVGVTGGGPYTYRWLFNGTNVLNDLITTVAGDGYFNPNTGVGGHFGDGGMSVDAALFDPNGVAVDLFGNLYIADSGNNVIRKVDTNGVITTVAGNYSLGAGYSGDGGRATAATLNNPIGVAVDPLGNIYIADSGNNTIRKVDTNGVITTVAGNNSMGGGYSGDGGPATNASLWWPSSVALDTLGNLFIADSNNSRVRRVDTNGTITTFAGKATQGYSGDGGVATQALLNYPSSVALDTLGNLFIADSSNSRVRKVDTHGIITTVAGGSVNGYSGDGGPAINASLSRPIGLALDGAGALFIADQNNQRIRKVDANGIITTVAGNGGNGFSGDGGAATNTSLSAPSGMAIDLYGNLLIADLGNNRIRKVLLPKQTLALDDVTGAEAGAYNVVISTPYGSVTSAVATLTVEFAPSIVTQPRNVEVPHGSNAVFSVAAAGTAPLEYQWYWNGVPLPGQTNTTLPIASANSVDEGAYQVVITNIYGSVTSQVVTLVAGYPPTITNEPASQTAVAGNNATLTVGVSGGGPYTYQWRLNGTNVFGDIITTVAGNGALGFSGDGGPATNANLNYPPAVAVDASGNLFIADPDDNVIRRVDGNGIITTVAGNVVLGGDYSGDGGPAINASLSRPIGLALDGAGALFIADSGNSVIRKVDTNGIITTVAGSAALGGGYSGDGGAATNAGLDYPLAVTVDSRGNLFIADSQNGVIRKVDAKGIITTVAGNYSNGGGYSGDGGAATNAGLSFPVAITVDFWGDLFIADQFNYAVRKVDTNGIITTFAGNGNYGYLGDGGPATNASLSNPTGVAVDSSGNVFVADRDNYVIREVYPNGIITTAAGNGFAGYSGDGGPATGAELESVILCRRCLCGAPPPPPLGVAVDGLGNLFIADNSNQRIRKVAFSSPTLSLQDVGAANAGAYDVVVTTPYGSVTSAVATLAVKFPPTIIPQEQTLAVVVGSNATLGVTASGTAPLAYQWYWEGGLLPAQTNATLQIHSVTLTNAGVYEVVVTNLYGSATSDGITLLVGEPPAITQEPASQTAAAGSNVVLTVAAAGGGPYTYQWLFNGGKLPNDLITTVAGGGGIGNHVPATNTSIAPAAVTLDASGNLFIADSGNSVIRKVDVNGIITTVAGNGTAGYSGDGGWATNATLRGPSGIVLDPHGNLFIADSGNAVVRKVDTNGIITTAAGNGSYGYSGDGGTATNASLAYPNGVAVDAFGNLFIADSANNRIRKVDTNGIITTVAGDGASLWNPESVAVDTSGNLFIADSNNNRIRKVDTKGIITTVAGGSVNGYSGDGGPAVAAHLAYPRGVAVDGSANLFIADTGNSRVRKVDANGVITTVAGNGGSYYTGDGGPATNASLDSPSCVVVDRLGNLYIADSSNYRVREVSANGIITTLAGNGSASFSGDGGAATSADLWNPSGVAVDIFGNLVIADAGNNRVRKVDETGFITTLAGNGLAGYSGDGGAATNTSLNAPSGVAADGLGNFFIADSGNNLIRKVDTNGIITTVAGSFALGAGYSGDGGVATQALLNNPSGVAVDGLGNFFTADSGNNLIRRVDANGVITTVAGSFALGAGYSGDGGPATRARLSYPNGMALDDMGDLFIADLGNNVIRKVDPNGIITTVAGNGVYAYAGDGGAATNASLSGPSGLTLDPSGNLYITDQGNNVIRKVDANGIIETVAGDGVYGYFGDGDPATKASLASPAAVAVDNSGNLFIADSRNNRVREVEFSGIPELILHGILAASGGGYQVIVSSPFGSVTSAVATLTALAPPIIISQPENVAVAVGNAASLRVDADGPQPLSFAWYFNGTNLVAAGTNSTLFLARAGVTNAGVYRVVVSNLFGSATSGPVTLSVGYPPTITNEPVGRSVALGGEALLSVSVSGTGPFSYQWRFNGVELPNDIITTVAGTGLNGHSGDGGQATNASLWEPSSVALDTLGNLYIADAQNGRIRRVDTNGTITTFAGKATQGYSGDGGPATSAELWEPCGVAIDALGNLFIADYFIDRIRKVDTHGIITTVAGGSVNGYSGDGGPAVAAHLAYPRGVAVDGSANLFIADTGNNRVRKVDPNGVITTVAGNGGSYYTGDGGPATNASLGNPEGVVVDSSGNLLIAEAGNDRIRKVDTNGIITTVAGNGAGAFYGDGGPATDAELLAPTDVALDALGNLFIADSGNHRIRKVDAYGAITTVAGNGVYAYAGDGGAATNASLWNPQGVAVDPMGDVFIADTGNNVVRKIGVPGPTLVLEDTTTNQTGNYDVIISNPFGSVTSVVATLAVIAPPLIAMNSPAVLGRNLTLGFSLTQGSASSFTLLQSPALTGPWATNSSAALSTNTASGGYQFTLPAPGSTEFYQIRTP